MATGGTIPANRTQTVRFYNTCGVVDKDKNVYLSPRFTSNSVIGKKVNIAYLEALEAVCPPSSAYTDIAISGWSPQDRTLVVRGNIDDFRLVTEEGACLNYLIVTRNVTKGLVTKTYYYGFFITGVEQSGGSSVRLTLEPDDFTNVFYLHNEYVMNNIGYEPFNDRMKNCHVNRQHYNRVAYGTSSYLLTVPFTSVQSGIDTERLMNQDILIEFRGTPLVEISGKVVGFDASEYVSDNKLTLVISTTIYDEIPVPQTYSEFWIEGTGYLCDYDIDDIEWETVKPILPTNERIFLNQEESFKFKYQYRDYKSPFYFSDHFTRDELDLIKNTDSFSNLAGSLQQKIIKSCIQYLVIEMKSKEKFGFIRAQQNYGDDPTHVDYQRDYANNVSGLDRACPVVFVPFINIPDMFLKYESSLKAYKFYASLKNSGASAQEIESASSIYNRLNNNSLADFVYTAYVVSDICLEGVYSINTTNKRINLLVDNEYGVSTSAKGLYPVPLNHTSTSPQINGFIYTYNSYQHYATMYADSWTIPDGISLVLMLSDYNSREFSLDFTDNYDNINNEYKDPVLEAEPYSFYSLSYLAYEMPFNKNRYYESYNVKISYYLSVNGATKLSFIPTYIVENNEYKYYNESLIFTLPANLPLVSDSYATYYYQNQAQMKNQFAVNDYNRGVDLAQHFFISGPNAVGNQAFKRGGWGAIAETVNQVGQMLDEGVDWAQSNKVIEMNQKAKLADMGAKPDVVKQAGSDIFSDLVTGENRLYLNHYTIDEASYNSIAKFLERFGYQINLYDTLHVMDRVGWNYIKTNSFDWNPDYDIMVEQEENLIKIFSKGVTLLHNKAYLTSGHNYETILDS